MRKSLESIQKDIAENLREARTRAGMSQEALALAAEVDRTYVSQIERGIGNPSVGVLHRLAACVNKDVSELLRRR